MEIDNLISNIRKSNIGNIMYKVKPMSSYLGVFGLKQRPDDAAFLETGTVENIDIQPVIRKSYKFFRTIIPKDFALTVYPKHWIKTADDTYSVLHEYHLVDIDVYTYLAVAEGISSGTIPNASHNYSHLFYYDGRFVDYTNLLNQYIPKFTFILANESKLIPYIWQKKDSTLFGELSADDFLVESSPVNSEKLNIIFKNLNIFTDSKKVI